MTTSSVVKTIHFILSSHAYPDEISKPWLRCKSYPSKSAWVETLSGARSHEFCLISKKEKALFCYDAHSDDWRQQKTPKALMTADWNGINGLVMNEGSNTMCRSSFDGLFLAEFEEDGWLKMSDLTNSALVAVDGAVHVIGGYKSSKHFVLKQGDRSLEEVHDFKDLEGFSGTALVYVRSKKSIFMIGGCSGFRAVGIWRYSLISREWKKLKALRFDYFGSQLALSSNEEHVIIAGGTNLDPLSFIDENNPFIHVLDIGDDEDCKLRKCSISCPLPGHHDIVRMGGGRKDELLVVGWIKALFESERFQNEQLPPSCILGMIARWYFVEEIHWIRRDRDDHKMSNHLAINLQHILNALE